MKKSAKSRSRPGHKSGHQSGRKSGHHTKPKAVGKSADTRTSGVGKTVISDASHGAAALLVGASRLAIARLSPATWFNSRHADRVPSSDAYRSQPEPLSKLSAAHPSAAVRAAATYDNDDRSTVFLMMVPFLVIGLSLGISQTVKPFISNLPTPNIARAPSAPIGTQAVDQAALAAQRLAAWTPPALPWARDLSPPRIDATPLPPVGAAPTPLSVPLPPVAIPPAQLEELAAQRLAAWTPPALPWPRDLSPPQIDASPLPISTAPLPRPQLSPVIIAPPAPVMTLPDTPPLVISPIIATPIIPDTPQFCERAPKPVLPTMGRPTVPPHAVGAAIATAAVAQTEHFVIYSATYRRINYPMGDLSSLYGACSDVIIRAYRTIGLDLQELVQRARSVRGDSNIDHRRTETLRKFFAQYGESLTPTAFPEDYKPGDIVTYYRPFSRISRAHIAIVSDVRAPTGRFMIAHNRGWGPQLEDALFVDRITGHYRFDGTRLPTAAQTTIVANSARSRLDGAGVDHSAASALQGTLRRQQRAKARQLSRESTMTPTSAVIDPVR